MPSPRPEFYRRAVRWLLPAALLALVPKCVLCVLAYAGLGAALGLGGPEICGVADDFPVGAVVGLIAASGTAGMIAFRRFMPRRALPPRSEVCN